MDRLTFPDDILSAASSSRGYMDIRNIIARDGESDTHTDDSTFNTGRHFSSSPSGNFFGSNNGHSDNNSNSDGSSNDDGEEGGNESSQQEESDDSDDDNGTLNSRRLYGVTNVRQTPFANKIDLAADYQDSTVISSSDDTFGAAANLIKTVASTSHTNEQLNEEDEFRDGWLVKRHENVGYATIRLGARGIVRGIDIDLTGYTQCAPLSASVHGFLGGGPDLWVSLVNDVVLEPNSHNFFEIRNNTFVHSYINITVTPGGGVARLRCYGDVEPMNASNRLEFNLASSKLGAEILQQPPDIVRGEFPNLIINRKESNQDGWISPRKRIAEPFDESEYTIIKLAGESAIDRIVVDTVHFIGNAPLSVCLEGCYIDEQEGAAVPPHRFRNASWRNLISEDQEDNIIIPNYCNVLPCTFNGPITHVRYRPIPDGGVQQISVKGHIFGSKPEVLQQLPPQPKSDIGPHKKRKRNDENQDAQEEHRRKSSRTKKPVSRFQ
ncbi:hypothetical protein [Parasitella parasitica]|uniref:Allantoicase domain-containing protein n=1 Tax=Parasitella parasitica TaxID=35722 RepID=A0A0B7MXG8_9FUNG|nr:hypothetical protein [Parasitella parasitica]